MSLNDAKKNKGRDARGRFAEGNPGGPGNPYTRQTALLRQVVQEELNEVEIRIIVQRLKAVALAGDVQAIKLVLAYAVGKPENAVNPDEVDRLEWELRQRLSVPAGEVERLAERVPARQANAVAAATAQAVSLQRGLDIFQRLQQRGLLPESLRPAASAPRPGVRGGTNGHEGAHR
jgi:hypothetical protein